MVDICPLNVAWEDHPADRIFSFTLQPNRLIFCLLPSRSGGDWKFACGAQSREKLHKRRNSVPVPLDNPQNKIIYKVLTICLIECNSKDKQQFIFLFSKLAE